MRASAIVILLVVVVTLTSLASAAKLRKRKINLFQPRSFFPQVLSPPLHCYRCQNSLSHEECNAAGLFRCEDSQTSCETEVRIDFLKQELVPKITKRCKQTLACNNNNKQNERPGWPSTQCNNIKDFPMSVCRYCCGESGCNSDTGEPHCHQLEPPKNGKMNCVILPYVTSSVCAFTCDECFMLEGTSVRTCMSDRTWSGKATECVYDPNCRQPQCDVSMTKKFENGDVTCSKGASVGSICEFNCNKGFHIFGSRKVECLDSKREWDTDRPICEEADTSVNPCHKFATFEYNREGNLTCKCRNGFQGDGIVTCDDVDECLAPPSTDQSCLFSSRKSVKKNSVLECPSEMNFCNQHATCTNTVGSYLCQCNEGFTGDGIECSDVDECRNESTNDCDVNGICLNEFGGYSCICAPEYTGDGRTCTKLNVQCPRDSLRDGQYCIRKNITVPQTTTSSPLTTVAKVVNTSSPKTTDAKVVTTSSPLVTVAKVASTASPLTTVAKVATTSSQLTTVANGTTTKPSVVITTTKVSKATSDIITTATSDVTTPETASKSTITTTSKNDVTPKQSDVTTTDVTDSTSASTIAKDIITTAVASTAVVKATVATTTVAVVTTPEPEEDWCVSFERGTDPVPKTENHYKEINDKLQARVVPKNDMTTVILGPWIGLGDRFEQNVLRWRDGCIIKPTEFSKWAKDEPKIRNESSNCVHLVSDPVKYGTRDFLWKVLDCSAPKRYLCNTEKTKKSGSELRICEPGIGRVMHGSVNCTNGWNANSVCSFTCDAGYGFRENYSRVLCMSSTLKWNQPPPTCARESCSPPLTPPNDGKMVCTNSNDIGSECFFTCNEGYRLEGEDVATCLPTQEWSSSRPCCRDDCPPYARLNLFFVLDSSSSVGRKNFIDIKKFVINLQNRFVASDDFTHVSAIVYNSKIFALGDKKSFDSNEEFEEAIGDLAYKGIGTYTGKALDFVSDNYIGNREGVSDVVVLLTDGKATDDVVEPANRLQQLGAHVIAVGVKGANWNELNSIASKPTIDNVVRVDSFKDLEKTVRMIGDKVCKFQC